TAAVADLEDALHFLFQRRLVPEPGVLPIERMTDGGVETAFTHGRIALCWSTDRKGRTKKGSRAAPLASQCRDDLGHRVERFLEAAGMALLGLGERLEPVGDFAEAFLARGTRHAWIHVGVFVRLAGDRRL